MHIEVCGANFVHICEFLTIRDYLDTNPFYNHRFLDFRIFERGKIGVEAAGHGEKCEVR